MKSWGGVDPTDRQAMMIPFIQPALPLPSSPLPSLAAHRWPLEVSCSRSRHIQNAEAAWTGCCTFHPGPSGGRALYASVALTVNQRTGTESLPWSPDRAENVLFGRVTVKAEERPLGSDQIPVTVPHPHVLYAQKPILSGSS